MQYSKFFDELFSSPIVATDAALGKYFPYLHAHKEGTILEFPATEKLVMGFFDGMMKSPYSALGTTPENKATGVAIIPIHGLLTKNGSWWDPGTDEIAESLLALYADDSIKAIVFDFNSQGGTTHSIIPMEDAIAKRNKTIISAINPQCCSASNYLASLTDKIFSTHSMGEVGSIGIYGSWMNKDKFYANEGIKIYKIYPPESNWKNLPTREAEAGKTKLYQDEILSPWAIHFQDIVKKNRPNLDMTVDGILNGRTFYAFDAVKNGLIDGIKPMDEILNYAFDYNNRKKFENL